MRRRKSYGAALVLLCSIGSSFAAAGPGVNLSFDDAFSTANGAAGASASDGWTFRGDGYRFTADDTVALHGPRSLRIRRSTPGGGAARAMQIVAPRAIAENRIRVTAYIKTESVAGVAGLWLRIDGEGGLLYVDGMRDSGASGTSDWTAYEVQAPMFDAATRIEVGAVLRGVGTAWFDAVTIDGVDTRGLPAPSPNAARYVERALDIMQRNSIRRQDIDWSWLRSATMSQARGAAGIADAYLAVRYALGSLGDHHSYLMTPQRAAGLRAEPVGNARTGRPARPPRSELLDGGIAYLSVPGFAGGPHAAQVRFAETLQHRIRELDPEQVCGWIVDLRDNTGGNLWPMLTGIGPLLGDGQAAAAQYPDGRQVPLWYRGGRAGLGDYVQLRVTTAPPTLRNSPRVAVLLGPSTASSGEIIAGAFRGSERYRSFGLPTRGLSTGNKTFDLSDGAAMVLTVAATRDRTGAIHFGPLEPDEVAAERDDLPVSGQPAVRAASGWLQRNCRAADAPAGSDPPPAEPDS